MFLKKIFLVIVFSIFSLNAGIKENISIATASALISYLIVPNKKVEKYFNAKTYTKRQIIGSDLKKINSKTMATVLSARLVVAGIAFMSLKNVTNLLKN